MKAFIAIALLALSPIAASAVAYAGSNTPSYDSCHTFSEHGIWDCR